MLNSTVKISSYKPDGMLRYSRIVPFNSFTAQFFAAWWSAFSNTAVTMKNATGADSASQRHTTKYFGNADAGVDGRGIIVGSGNTAFSFTNHILDAKIAHGTGAGQLSYLEQSRFDQMTSNSIAISRSFRNDSGATININEIGVQTASSAVSSSTLTPNFLFQRDVLAEPYPVFAGDIVQITIDYHAGGDFNMSALFMLYGQIFIATANSVRWDGAASSFNATTETVYRAEAEADRRGVFVGTGNIDPTAFVPTNADGSCRLEAIIANGTAAGQMSYGAMSVGARASSGSTHSFICEKAFLNESGAEIVVNESCLVVGLGTTLATNQMVARRILDTPVAVPNLDGIAATATLYIISPQA